MAVGEQGHRGKLAGPQKAGCLSASPAHAESWWALDLARAKCGETG